MDIDIRMLAERLAPYEPKLYINDEGSTLVKAPKLLIGRRDELDDGYIYVGRLSSLPEEFSTFGRVNLICIKDKEFDERLIEKNNANLLLLCAKTELDEVFNLVQDIFISSQEMQSNAPRFLDSLVHGRGLQHILDIGYELLKNPIVLFDTKSNLIAHSANIETDDPVNAELLKNGRLSNDTISFIWETDHQKSLNNRRYPYYFKSEKLKYNRIVGNIYNDKKKVALMVVWENERPFDDKDIDLVAQLCEIISSEMQRSEYYRNMKDVLFESFMADLLDGRTKYTEPAIKRFNSIDWKLKRNLFLLVIDISGFETGFREISRIRDTIEYMIRDCRAFIYGHRVLALISRDTAELRVSEELKELSQFLRDNNMYAGISKCFGNMADIQAYFAQAVKAIELGSRISDKVIFPYEEYQIFRLLEAGAAQEDLMRLCHSALLSLLEHDKANNADYLKTLYIYLVNGQDSSNTAAEMHTHRNTILYRVARIKELLDIDFKNGELVFQLMLSYKILNFLGKLSF